MQVPSYLSIINGPDDVASLSRVAVDLRALLYGSGVPADANLDQAPLLDGWCETLVPLRGIIGLSGSDKPASLVRPIFALSRTHGWARTLHGWVRLGRHVDEMQ